MVESIDAGRLATRVASLEASAGYLAVTLLSEIAATLDEDDQNVTDSHYILTADVSVITGPASEGDTNVHRNSCTASWDANGSLVFKTFPTIDPDFCSYTIVRVAERK